MPPNPLADVTEPAPRSLFRTVVPPIILPVFLAAADGTVVATALPAIVADLGEVELLSWVVVANLIASTVVACGTARGLPPRGWSWAAGSIPPPAPPCGGRWEIRASALSWKA